MLADAVRRVARKDHSGRLSPPLTKEDDDGMVKLYGSADNDTEEDEEREVAAGAGGGEAVASVEVAAMAAARSRSIDGGKCLKSRGSVGTGRGNSGGSGDSGDGGGVSKGSECFSSPPDRSESDAGSSSPASWEVCMGVADHGSAEGGEGVRARRRSSRSGSATWKWSRSASPPEDGKEHDRGDTPSSSKKMSTKSKTSSKFRSFLGLPNGRKRDGQKW